MNPLPLLNYKRTWTSEEETSKNVFDEELLNIEGNSNAYDDGYESKPFPVIRNRLQQYAAGRYKSPAKKRSSTKQIESKSDRFVTKGGLCRETHWAERRA